MESHSIIHTTNLKGIEGPKLPQTFAGDHILLLSWHLIRTEDLIFSTEDTRRTEDLAVGTISVRYLMIFGFWRNRNHPILLKKNIAIW